MPRPHLTPGKDPVPILQGAGWASGPVWTGAENLAPTGVFFPKIYFLQRSIFQYNTSRVTIARHAFMYHSTAV